MYPGIHTFIYTFMYHQNDKDDEIQQIWKSK